MSAHDAVKHAVQFYTRNEQLSDTVAKAVLTDLKAGEYAVVKLPEPDRVINPSQSGTAMWWDDQVHAQEGSSKVRVFIDDPRLTATEARELATALLAAADIAETAAESNAPKCSSCSRPRTIADAYDYNPLQVVTGQPLGWYSGDDGEVCPECMTRIVGGQR